MSRAGVEVLALERIGILSTLNLQHTDSARVTGPFAPYPSTPDLWREATGRTYPAGRAGHEHTMEEGWDVTQLGCRRIGWVRAAPRKGGKLLAQDHEGPASGSGASSTGHSPLLVARDGSDCWMQHLLHCHCCLPTNFSANIDPLFPEETCWRKRRFVGCEGLGHLSGFSCLASWLSPATISCPLPPPLLATFKSSTELVNVVLHPHTGVLVLANHAENLPPQDPQNTELRFQSMLQQVGMLNVACKWHVSVFGNMHTPTSIWALVNTSTQPGKLKYQGQNSLTVSESRQARADSRLDCGWKLVELQPARIVQIQAKSTKQLTPLQLGQVYAAVIRSCSGRAKDRRAVCDSPFVCLSHAPRAGPQCGTVKCLDAAFRERVRSRPTCPLFHTSANQR
ncbi:hypothetical protein C8R43DRAFT_949346 [Mycena crocata]|nr:hypothetical protein C8R43DRAFT_949346 [Mycena crocata]